MHNNELHEDEKEIQEWRWREASGAVVLTLAAIVLMLLVATLS